LRKHGSLARDISDADLRPLRRKYNPQRHAITGISSVIGAAVLGAFSWEFFDIRPTYVEDRGSTVRFEQISKGSVVRMDARRV
jgi:hypothetical protein